MMLPIDNQGPVVVKPPANEEERLEVERWKEERRKHYPTASNIAKRAAEAKSREEAGALFLKGALQPSSKAYSVELIFTLVKANEAEQHSTCICIGLLLTPPGVSALFAPCFDWKTFCSFKEIWRGGLLGCLIKEKAKIAGNKLHISGVCRARLSVTNSQVVLYRPFNKRAAHSVLLNSTHVQIVGLETLKADSSSIVQKLGQLQIKNKHALHGEESLKQDSHLSALLNAEIM
eukprot:751485-Pelagomonas_calceolata.AAC.1